MPPFPIEDCLESISQILETQNRLILQAPPGAGKTTLVPLHILRSQALLRTRAPVQTGPSARLWLQPDHKIIVLEPRRLAARAAAQRMAFLLGEQVGKTVGYQMRFEKALCADTRILVVTEGVLSRILVDDPEAHTIGALIFDEFHERHLEGDLALALSVDIQKALRPDLRLIVMSATLEQQGLRAYLGDPPCIKTMGRCFETDILYWPVAQGLSIEEAMVQALIKIHAQEDGSILAFLPGQREIERVAKKLAPFIPDQTEILPLYGALEAQAQQKAIAPPAPTKRKIVLSTSLAESSLTIEGVSIVVDSGLARSAVFEPDTGLSRLITEKASLAAITQRAGRAGRSQKGRVIRLWHKEQNAALLPFTPPEITRQDPSKILLDCAAFGVPILRDMPFLDYPSPALIESAQARLKQLGALDSQGKPTPLGHKMRHLPFAPSLAAMVLSCQGGPYAYDSVLLAFLLSERALFSSVFDLDERLHRLKTCRSSVAQKARKYAAQISGNTQNQETSPALGVCGQLLVQAFPERIAQKKGLHSSREHVLFLLAKGGAVSVPQEEPLAQQRFIIVGDLAGKPPQRRALCAASLKEEDIFTYASGFIQEEEDAVFDKSMGAVVSKNTKKIGALFLSTTPIVSVHSALVKQRLTQAFARYGLELLPQREALDKFLARLYWLHKNFESHWPCIQEAELKAKAESWLLPFLPDTASFKEVSVQRLLQAVQTLLPYGAVQQMNHLAPEYFSIPNGKTLPIVYRQEHALLRAKCQDLFGLRTHPYIGGGKKPLRIELLSPAMRPLQITTNIEEFWRGSWKDIRKEMRGRYPKHPWPENPHQERVKS